MAKLLVDIVNLNADASCLETERWFRALEGGTNSELYQWLNAYALQNKRVTLGITGATAADMAMLNPESIRLINVHADVFEVIYRPFAHDAAQLRRHDQAMLNQNIGKRTIDQLFRRRTNAFLPPEFMLPTDQLVGLVEHEQRHTFVNARRLSPEQRERIPDHPYHLRDIFLDTYVTCHPVDGGLTTHYLHALHFYNSEPWNKAVRRASGSTALGWRDGESFLFVPDGVGREADWLAGESEDFSRIHFSEYVENLTESDLRTPESPCLRHYPIHSLTPWSRDSRMVGFLQTLHAEERIILKKASFQKAVWLQAINSDILSSVEKTSPQIRLIENGKERDFTIWRTERHTEGIGLLYLLTNWNEELERDILAGDFDEVPYLEKLRLRHQFLTDRGIL